MYVEGEDIEMCTSKGAEECMLNSLDSTRGELRANLVAEILLNQFNEAFGDEAHQTVNYICDSKSAMHKLGEENMKKKE